MPRANGNRLPQIRATADRIEELVRNVHEEPMVYSEGLLQELHQLMTSGDSEVSNSDFRTGRMKVVHRKANGDQVTILCPPAAEVPERIERLIAYLNRPPGSEAAMRERIAMGTLSLVQTHPFSEGNGRAARALLALRLRVEGYLADRDAVVCFLHDYFEVAGQKQILGDLIEKLVVDNDRQPWIDYFRALFTILRDNGGRIPDMPPSPEAGS
jgi:fido (protein-threonine AMPylation protein)